MSLTIEQVGKFVQKVLSDGVFPELNKRNAELVQRIHELEERVAKAEQKGLSFKGVHQRANGYIRGDCVTRQGSLWIALCETDRTPGDGGDWQLAVKAGRDAT